MAAALLMQGQAKKTFLTEVVEPVLPVLLVITLVLASFDTAFYVWLRAHSG
jgi:hypothetical protein